MKRTILVVLSLLALALVACGGAEVEPGEQNATLIARDIEFDKQRLEVRAGVPVVLTLDNEGLLEHDFSIMHIPLVGEAVSAEDPHGAEHEMSMPEEDLAVHVLAGAGEHGSVTFTPAEPGEYEYFCTVAGHKEAGMAGTLVVAGSR